MVKLYHFLFLAFPTIVLAQSCQFDFQPNAESELVTGLGFKPLTNFRSINIKFPETPTSKLFECATKPSDYVHIEAKYKIVGGSSTKWQDIKSITLQNDESFHEEQLFGPGQAEACSTYKIRLIAKKNNKKKDKKSKVIRFKTGPNSLKENDVIVSNISDTSATLDWSNFDYTGCSDVIFQVNNEETSETIKQIENLDACKEHEIPILPIFNGNNGLERKISVNTFPNTGIIGNIEENENEITFNTDGLRNCYFQKFKILFKIEQQNPDQKQK